MRRFSPISENAPVGTVAGVILAAAINQTIVYSIIEGNEGGECLPDLHNLFSESSAKTMQKGHAIKPSLAVLIHAGPSSICFNQTMVYSFIRNLSEKKTRLREMSHWSFMS